MSDIKFTYIAHRNIVHYAGKYVDDVRHHFSIPNKNAGFARRHGARWVPERIYAISPTGTFHPGLLNGVLRFVRDRFKDVEIEIDPVLLAVCKPSYNIPTFNKLSLPLRDYQLTAVSNCIESGRGVVKLGTGGGKTLVIASLLSSVYNHYKDNSRQLKVLMVVPDLGLVFQTLKDFKTYKVPFTFSGFTGSMEPNLTSNVIIANSAILQKRFKEFITSGFLPKGKLMDMIIVDEVHKVRRGNEIVKIIDRLPVHNRFGFTGTLPENKIDEWNVIGRFGPVIFEKNSAELRDESYLADVTSNIINISYTAKPTVYPGTEDLSDYQLELDFIKDNKFRNTIIKSLVNLATTNTLVMVNRIEHGEILHKFLSDNTKKKIYFIRGEIDVQDRMEVIQQMEQESGIVCIAITAIFSTGINIKNLHNIIFASGGKSLVQVVQSIGRGLRLHETKTKLTIYDIADNLKYGAEHSKQRCKIYDSESIKYKIVSLKEG